MNTWMLVYELIAGTPVAVPVASLGQCVATTQALYAAVHTQLKEGTEKEDASYTAMCIDPAGSDVGTQIVFCEANYRMLGSPAKRLLIVDCKVMKRFL